MNDWIMIESRPLTMAEMENNAEIIWNFFGSLGWTINAVSAMLGNMEAESTINPGRWEGDNVGNLSGGFGLVQWTPATKLRVWISETYASVDFTNGYFQMERIKYEHDYGGQWIKTSKYPLTFQEWSISEKPPAYLAEAFLINYERPGDQSDSVKRYRGALAEKWYTVLTGLPAPHYFRLPVWLLFKMSERM